MVVDWIVLIVNGDFVEYGNVWDIYCVLEKVFIVGFVGENNVLNGKVSYVNGVIVIVDVVGL